MRSWRGMRIVRLFPVVAVAIAGACHPRPSVVTSATADTSSYEPSRALGTLFHDVQLAGVFPDSKTFVDSRPLEAPSVITAAYASERGQPGFSLQTFVQQHFEMPRAAGADYKTDTTLTMEQHAKALWPALTRVPDSSRARSSLIPLPFPYVVPGGRFREIYYWDSYFTMLGLVESPTSTS